MKRTKRWMYNLYVEVGLFTFVNVMIKINSILKDTRCICKIKNEILSKQRIGQMTMQIGHNEEE